MSEYVREVNERDFDQVVLKSKTPVLVKYAEVAQGRSRLCKQSIG